jgi:hypothetical protein
MDESVIRFPVKCPMCGQESLVGFTLNTILQTLATDRPIKFHANCGYHRVVWVASDIERRQIRDYTAEVNCPPRRYAPLRALA